MEGMEAELKKLMELEVYHNRKYTERMDRME